MVPPAALGARTGPTWRPDHCGPPPVPGWCPILSAARPWRCGDRVLSWSFEPSVPGDGDEDTRCCDELTGGAKGIRTLGIISRACRSHGGNTGSNPVGDANLKKVRPKSSS